MTAQSSYDDTHRRFLKTLMTCHTVPQDKAIEVYCSCRNPEKSAKNASHELGKDSKKAIVTIIQQINAKIEPLNMSIKLVTCEATDKKYYVLYSLNENEVTKAITGRQRGKNERALITTLIKTIMKSPTGKVSKAACIRDCNELPEKIKRSDVLKIVNKLVLEGWFCEINEQVYVGPRSVAELGKFLSEEYEDEVTCCKLCKEATFRGPTCPSNCGVRVHSLCLEAYFDTVKMKKCMGCKEPWPVALKKPLEENTPEDDSNEETSDLEAMEVDSDDD